MTPNPTKPHLSPAWLLLPLLAALLALPACRGNTSDQAPVHLNPNMDDVDYVEAQEGSAHFADGRGMRPQVPGTVARGEARTDAHLHLGQVDGKPAATLPVPLSKELLLRGQQRYGVYCLPCHGGAGTGDGIVVKRGLIPPPSFLDKRIRAMELGQIYDVIRNGVRNMPAYDKQIPARDRWAIVAYVRALQAARSARLGDVPKDIADSKGWTK